MNGALTKIQKASPYLEKRELGSDTVTKIEKKISPSFEDHLRDARESYSSPDPRFERFSEVFSAAEELGSKLFIRAFVRDCFSKGEDPETIEDLLNIAKAGTDKVGSAVVGCLNEVSKKMEGWAEAVDKDREVEL